jgi:predicted outer membrane lipoprotein
MSTVVPRTHAYQEFCNFVRRFNQEQLLTTIARIALALPDNVSKPGYANTPPWALAAIVKASVLHGNPYRHTQVRPRDILVACQMYNDIATEELGHPELASAFAILTRLAYEQFQYQESAFPEMTRPLVFFDDYSGRKRLEVISKASLTELIGAPLTTALGIALMLHASTEANGGFFNPTWIDQTNFVRVLEVLPRHEVLAVIDSIFANSFDDFKRQDAEAARRAPLPYLDRYQFNPLTARPLLRLADGRLLAPVPHTIMRKLAPLELYYAGLQKWDQAFTRDMGELLEDYLGRQFAALPHAAVHPEVTYRQRRSDVKSVDWIVVLADLVVLVEAKATRAPAGARAAGETARDAYVRVLGEAFGQINRTYKAVQGGVPEFDHIPKDRPVMGMVGTLDPWYIANSLARSFLPATDLPTMVASVRDIEHLVAVGQRRPVSGALAEIIQDGDERQTWELGVALRDFYQPGDRNPLLQRAWERLPFGRDTNEAQEVANAQ